jgi:hypothetical protein
LAGKSKEKINEIINRETNLFGNFVLKIEKLLQDYDKPRFNRYKYVSSLPVGVYKSLNLLINELLNKNYYKKAYTKFLKFLNDDERKEIIKDLLNIIIDNNAKISVDKILQMIYEEDNSHGISEILDLFPSPPFQSEEDLNKILATITRAWNYFPHKNLSGLAPIEKRVD